MNTLARRPSTPDSRVRVVIAKPGLDGHDRGAKVIARALRNAGHEVIYTGLHQTPAQIVPLLKERGAGDIRVMVGGIIPAADVPVLRAMGVHAVFTPGANIRSVTEAVKQAGAGREQM